MQFRLSKPIVLAVTGMFLLSSMSYAALSCNPKQKYQHHFKQQKMEIQWTFHKKQIDFSITAPTTGWLAVGFNPTDKMKDANIFIGYIKKGKAFVRHDCGYSEISHSQVDNKTILSAGGYEHHGQSTLCFSVPRVIQGAQGQKLSFTPGASYDVIYAYGDNGEDNYSSYHSFREISKIKL